MGGRWVYFWKGVLPLVRRFCREHNVRFNALVNQAVLQFLGRVGDGRLRLEAELERLLREEAELRRVQNCMLRSGAYLPGYVARVLRKPGGVDLLRRGELPLEALAGKREVEVFLKICQRREEIARRICEIQEQLLADVEPFQLPGDGCHVKKAGEGGDKSDE